MLEGFARSAQHIHRAYLEEWMRQAETDALRRRARVDRRFRRAVGRRLLVMGRRMVDTPDETDRGFGTAA